MDRSTSPYIWNRKPSSYEFRKHRESLKKFRKYVGKLIAHSSKYRSGNDQPKIRKIEVI